MDLNELENIAETTARQVMKEIGEERCKAIKATSRVNAALLMVALHPNVTEETATVEMKNEVNQIFAAMYGIALGAYHSGMKGVAVDQEPQSPHNAETALRIAAQALLEAMDGGWHSYYANVASELAALKLAI